LKITLLEIRYTTSIIHNLVLSYILKVCYIQVLYAHPMDQFNVHFPFRHGDLNIHSGVGGSLSSVLADLETIWGHCIVNLLEIPKSELKVHFNYSFFSNCLLKSYTFNVKALQGCASHSRYLQSTFP
jgi:hypothetical protein